MMKKEQVWGLIYILGLIVITKGKNEMNIHREINVDILLFTWNGLTWNMELQT